MVRSMMVHASLPISFWGDALLTVAYILNHMPSKIDFNNTIWALDGQKAWLKLHAPTGGSRLCSQTPMLMRNLALKQISAYSLDTLMNPKSMWCSVNSQMEGLHEGAYAYSLYIFLKWTSHMKALLILIKKMRVTYCLVGATFEWECTIRDLFQIYIFA